MTSSRARRPVLLGRSRKKSLAGRAGAAQQRTGAADAVGQADRHGARRRRPAAGRPQWPGRRRWRAGPAPTTSGRASANSTASAFAGLVNGSLGRTAELGGLVQGIGDLLQQRGGESLQAERVQRLQQRGQHRPACGVRMQVPRQRMHRRSAGSRGDLRIGRRHDSHRQTAARPLLGQRDQPRVSPVDRPDEQRVCRAGPPGQLHPVPWERGRRFAAEPGDQPQRSRGRRVAGHEERPRQVATQAGDTEFLA